MWLDVLFQRCIDAVQSERISEPVRVICIVLKSIVFPIAIVSLFLLTFVIEGQIFLRRVAFLLLELGITGYYVKFVKTVVRGRGEEKKS